MCSLIFLLTSLWQRPLLGGDLMLFTVFHRSWRKRCCPLKSSALHTGHCFKSFNSLSFSRYFLFVQILRRLIRMGGYVLATKHPCFLTLIYHPAIFSYSSFNTPLAADIARVSFDISYILPDFFALCLQRRAKSLFKSLKNLSIRDYLSLLLKYLL